MRLMRHALRTWFHTARLLYVFLLAFVVNVLLSEVQLIVTSGWGAAFDLGQLRSTYFWHLAATYPVYFWSAFVLVLSAAVSGFLLDRRLRSEHISTNSLPLRRVRALKLTAFKLGDDDAATMRYLAEPVQAAYDAAEHALHEASVGRSPKRGIVVLGEANAGKTRLALEVLIRTLPRWAALVWNEAYTAADIPPASAFADRNIVLFLDDLPNYAAASAGSGSGTSTAIPNSAATLRALEDRLQEARRWVVVATCRSEDEDHAQASLGWLFTKLAPIRLPRFSDNAADPQTQQVIAAFARAGARFADAAKWDGTIGSLVLGLDAKRDEYQALRVQRSPAVPLLHAAKLLTTAGITEHTERRLRGVSARVLGETALEQDERVWKEAVGDATRLQFMRQTRAKDGRSVVLVIRKDAYFEQVITDYPAADQPYQLEQHFDRLQVALAALGDAEALGALGDVAERRGHYQIAANSLRSGLEIHRAQGDVRGEASDLAALGLVEVRRGNLDDAEHYLARAQQLASEQGERGVEAEILNYRGAVAQRHGHTTEAENFFTQALDVYREVHDLQGEGASLGYLGRAARRRGELEAAERYFHEGLQNLRDAHDRQGEGFFLNDLGEVALKRGQLDEADTYFRQSVAILRDVQDRQGEGVALYGIGRVAAQRHQLQDAEETLQQALGVIRKESDPYYESKILCSLAEVAEATGDLRAAEAHARASLELAESSSLTQEIADAQQALTRIRGSQPQDASG